MRTAVDEKLAAVKQANETLEIHLATGCAHHRVKAGSGWIER